MPTKVVVCDTPDGLAQLQYVLIKSGAALEIEAVTDGLRAVEFSARTRPSSSWPASRPRACLAPSWSAACSP
jgi:hypothetical protein